MHRFVALRHQNTPGGWVEPGDFVPGAENWPPHILQSNVCGGYLFDLDREVRVPVDNRAASQRERGLLEELRIKGVEIIESAGRWKIERGSVQKPVPEAASVGGPRKKKKG